MTQIQRMRYAYIRRHSSDPGGSGVKNLPAYAGDARDTDSIFGSGESPEKGMATQSSSLAGKTHGQEEHGGLQSMGSQRLGHNLAAKQQQ